MPSSNRPSAFNRVGTLFSGWVSDLAATPAAQIAVILVCGAWFAGGFQTDLLTAILSILAITLTQMVLNRQGERETDAHRRDVAMHAKLDELVIAVRGARNEMAGIEELEETDIRELKQEVSEAIDEAGEAAGTKRERAAAKQAAKKVIDEEVAKVESVTARRKADRAGA
jgi:low affinity Fe/Cu permease